jgi:peptide/nickel transport system substrate-binding protein
VHAQKDRQTLNFAAEADLKVLDPIWSTAYITRNHGYLIYDTLFGVDENLQIKPQMVDRVTVSPDAMRYTFTLRDGLKWHDGQPIVSEDCVESLKRWGKKDRFGQLLMVHTAKIVPVDRKTFTLELAEPFGPVLEALGKPSSNVPFMMPARIAATRRMSRSARSSAPGRSSSRVANGSRASRPWICATWTMFRGRRRQAPRLAARRRILMR